MPYSSIPLDDNFRGSDTDHYLFQDPEKFVIQKNEEPNFEITGYDMNFKIKNLLSGDVTVKVDNPNLTEYHFTLYYGYKLKSVTNSSGEKLKYDRDGDYITVHTDAPTESFNFKYKGFSQVFYSNSQSCELLGGFAYYPINGFRYVYSVADQGSIRTKLSTSVPMSVKVDCGKTMFSNLESTGKNTFEGTSDSLTLVSGFYKEINADGIRMIYPYYESPYDIDGVKDYETQLKMLIDKKPKYKGKTVILASGSGGSADDRIFTASDQVIAPNIPTIYDDTQEEFFEEMGDTITMPGKSNAAENLNRRGIASSSPRMESHIPPVKVEGTKPVAMKPKAAAKDMVWNDGDRVKHTIFGEGIITGVEGRGASQIVKVRFKNGSERRFSAAYTPLIKL